MDIFVSDFYVHKNTATRAKEKQKTNKHGKWHWFACANSFFVGSFSIFILLFDREKCCSVAKTMLEQTKREKNAIQPKRTQIYRIVAAVFHFYCVCWVVDGGVHEARVHKYKKDWTNGKIKQKNTVTRDKHVLNFLYFAFSLYIVVRSLFVYI